jgi:haloalkane dehalogenase
MEADGNGPDFAPSAQLYPFDSRWFDSSAGRLHYVDEGRGPAILMCHGNPTWSFLYRQLIRTLQGTFRCIAVDYLGFGLSDRPPGYGYTPAEHAGVVGELVRELDLKELIVMGHDWAGQSASLSRPPIPRGSRASSSATPGSGPPTAGPGPSAG